MQEGLSQHSSLSKATIPMHTSIQSHMLRAGAPLMEPAICDLLPAACLCLSLVLAQLLKSPLMVMSADGGVVREAAARKLAFVC